MVKVQREKITSASHLTSSQPHNLSVSSLNVVY